MSERDTLDQIAVDGCAYCRHLRSRSTCDAYPAGIPMVILAGERSHIEPFIGDGGVVFERYDAENPLAVNPALRRSNAGG
jgi:hypothetical protein